MSSKEAHDRQLVDRALDTNSAISRHVNCARRFDHMQQQYWAHFFVGFDREAGAKTVSFPRYIGRRQSIRQDLTSDPMMCGNIVNAVLWETEFCVRFVTANDAAKLPLRQDRREGEVASSK